MQTIRLIRSKHQIIMNKMVWMISYNWILKCSLWCLMLGACCFSANLRFCWRLSVLLFIFNNAPFISQFARLFVFAVNVSTWHFINTAVKALFIHFEYHWHLASYVSHFCVIIITLFHTFSSVIAAYWIVQLRLLLPRLPL